MESTKRSTRYVNRVRNTSPRMYRLAKLITLLEINSTTPEKISPQKSSTNGNVIWLLLNFVMDHSIRVICPNLPRSPPLMSISIETAKRDRLEFVVIWLNIIKLVYVLQDTLPTA